MPEPTAGKPIELATVESGAGTPLVLLHAFPLSSAMWARHHQTLAGSCRLITPDQRGWGGSPLGDDPPSLDRAADDLAALLDRRGLDRVVLGGLSMGGYVTMAFLRRHPGRVSGLLLADTKASADPPAAMAKRDRIAAELDRSGSTQVLLDEVFGGLLGPTTHDTRPELVAEVRAAVAAAPVAAAAWSQRAMAGRRDSIGVLAQVDVPALVVVGTEDALITDADVEAMAGALADVEVVRVPRSGHLTALEDPEAFAAAVRSLLTRVD